MGMIEKYMMRICRITIGIILIAAELNSGSMTFAASNHKKTDRSAGSDMVLIKGNFYTSLFKRAGEKSRQYVKAFYIDVHAVTNEQFLKFVKANPEWSRSNIQRIFADKNYLKDWQDDLILGDKVNPLSPVVNVSWFAANAYSKWAGKRLPTVAEWELASSGNFLAGSKSIINTNDKLIKWYSCGLPSQINSIMSTGRNSFGVYDMFGLVREWTYDFSDMNINGVAICGAGSSGATDLTNYPAFLRYGFRSSLKAGSTLPNLGFRCAKDLNHN
jgi:formylglycine-generating enzyme required for sulfatase activity